MFKKVMILNRSEISGEFEYNVSPVLLNMERIYNITPFHEFAAQEKAEYQNVITIFENKNNKKYDVLKTKMVEGNTIYILVEKERILLKG